LWRYAAVVAIIIAAGCISYWQGEVNVKDTFADISVEAPLGSKTKLYLPDGTLVWLNAGSRMTYSQGFGVDNRKVELEGEGYFEVKRNEKIPFFVKTKDLQLQVLGTKFNFRDYPEDHEVVVSLLEGKVGLNNLLREEKEAVLSPDERAVLNKANGLLTVESVTASNASQWTDGYLFFDEELLPDIAKELERSYNVKIHIANDSLKTFRFYGNFVRREQNIQEVLEALASTEKMQYKIEERNITIY
jgi:ferric-dicitrate binding protein FerR (iron transport regulator)